MVSAGKKPRSKNITCMRVRVTFTENQCSKNGMIENQCKKLEIAAEFRQTFIDLTHTDKLFIS